MTDQATPAKVRLTDGLGPLPEPHAVVDIWGHDVPHYTREQMREYARKAVDAEREKWRLLIDETRHSYEGGCPDASNWHSRDMDCPACRALGDWRA